MASGCVVECFRPCEGALRIGTEKICLPFGQEAAPAGGQGAKTPWAGDTSACRVLTGRFVEDRDSPHSFRHGLAKWLLIGLFGQDLLGGRQE
jgi:hypothetical protein